MKTAIILSSEADFSLAEEIKRNITGAQIYTKAYIPETEHINSLEGCVEDLFQQKTEAFVFVDDLPTCIQIFAPYIAESKQNQPTLVCVDNSGKYVVSVLLGSDNSGNIFAKRIAHIIGADPIITTRSESENLWTLETIGARFGWAVDTNSASFNYPQTSFVNKQPTALLLDVQDEGTAYLERTLPNHVTVYYKYEDIVLKNYELLIAVTPYLYPDAGIQIIYYHPQVLHIGIGCRKHGNPKTLPKYLKEEVSGFNIALSSIKSIASVDSKDEADLLQEFGNYFKNVPTHLYSLVELEEATGKDEDKSNNDSKQNSLTAGDVAEISALKSANNGQIIVGKQKTIINRSINDYTFSVALDRKAMREGHVEIVGAGPGDPDLISVKGKYLIEAADLILYSEKQVDVSITHNAKDGVVIRNIDALTIKEQFDLISEYYKKGKLIVRLNIGDSCIFGAIQEFLIFFDKHDMSYHITPGISSFSAAAAILESQFTISNQTEAIILTRDNLCSALPDRQKLQALAQSQSTMCIFLSATMAEDIQQQLLVHYPPTTPVAVCYKVTWKDQHIYRGELKDLAKIIADNKLVLNTLIVVGEAIGNREGLSQLYSDRFKHLSGY